MNVREVRFSPFSSAAIFTVALASAYWAALAVTALHSVDTLSGIAEAEEVPAITTAPLSASPVSYEYVEVIRGCGPYFDGEECVRSHAGPGEEYRVIGQLRKGVVLKVEHAVQNELSLWYKIIFDESLRYPERVAWEQYVAAEDVRHFYGNGVQTRDSVTNATSTKYILVDRSLQKLYAYEGEVLYMEVVISTGIQRTPTPRGNFTIYKKTPTRYMQGPLPEVSEKYYDLPGVPWNLYFTKEGGVIHGAYWHNSFGKRWSNGCVNLPIPEAQKLYEWADIGMQVLVRD